MVKSLKCHVCGFVLGIAEEDAGEGILSPGQLKIKHTPNDWLDWAPVKVGPPSLTGARWVWGPALPAVAIYHLHSHPERKEAAHCTDEDTEALRGEICGAGSFNEQVSGRTKVWPKIFITLNAIQGEENRFNKTFGKNAAAFFSCSWAAQWNLGCFHSRADSSKGGASCSPWGGLWGAEDPGVTPARGPRTQAACSLHAQGAHILLVSPHFAISILGCFPAHLPSTVVSACLHFLLSSPRSCTQDYGLKFPWKSSLPDLPALLLEIVFYFQLPT